MNLKLLAAPSLLAASMFTSTLAMAIDAELKIEGQIIAAPCTISAENGGIYDYGDIPQENLLVGEPYVPGAATRSIDISCPAPMFVGLKMLDNREGTEYEGTVGSLPSNSARQGLSLDAEGNPIGAVGYRLQTHPTVNGIEGRLLAKDSLGADGNWGSYSPGGASYSWLPLDRYYSFAEGTGSTPSALSSVTLPLQITTYIAPKETLSLTRGLDLDGSVTVELVYL